MKVGVGLSNYWNWWDQYWSRMPEAEREEEIRKRKNRFTVIAEDGTVLLSISEFDSNWNRKACEEARERREARV
jgi:hypothetical protein